MRRAEGDAPPSTGIRWPDVPACYGWLSLDRRGRWKLNGDPVRHEGLIAYLNRNYGPDADGNWLVRNGPQQVFVDLDYMPLVARIDGPDLVSHTGDRLGKPACIWLDEEGSIVMRFSGGSALLDDRDLPSFLDECDFSESAEDGGVPVAWRGHGIQPIRKNAIPAICEFNPRPST